MSSSIEPGARHSEPDDPRHRVRRVMDRLFVLERTIAVHGDHHPVTQQAAAATAEAVEDAGPPFAVQFVDEMVFHDRALVVLDAAGFSRGQRLGAALRAIGASELAFDATPSPDELVALAGALARGAPPDRALEGVRLRRIGDTLGGAAGEAVDPERFMAVQLVRAVMDVERLAADGAAAWGWSRGAAVLRRIERALEASPRGTPRFLERFRGERSVPLRAVQAATLCLAAMAVVGVEVTSRRATAHALLAACLAGYEPRAGAEFALAATRSLERTTAGLGRGQGDPHRRRACAVLHDAVLRPEARERWHPATVLVAMLYDYERSRCPEGVGFDLDATDLLAMLVERFDGEVAEAWAQALAEVTGLVPPGMRVRTAGGVVGRVIGGEGSARLVYSGGELRVAAGAVEFVGGEEVG